MVIQQQNKLALQEIRQKFSTIVRERKKETGPVIFSTNGSGNAQGEKKNDDGTQNKSQERNVMTPTKTHKRGASEENQTGSGQQQLSLQNAEEKSIYYKDTAIIRFEDEAVKVVRDTEFINEFRRRANDSFWHTVNCI